MSIDPLQCGWGWKQHSSGWQLYASHMAPLLYKSGNFMVPVAKSWNHKAAVLRKKKYKVAKRNSSKFPVIARTGKTPGRRPGKDYMGISVP